MGYSLGSKSFSLGTKSPNDLQLVALQLLTETTSSRLLTAEHIQPLRQPLKPSPFLHWTHKFRELVYYGGGGTFGTPTSLSEAIIGASHRSNLV